jgi:hypothetical protein
VYFRSQQAMASKFEELIRYLATLGGMALPPGLLAPIALPPSTGVSDTASPRYSSEYDTKEFMVFLSNHV